MLQPFHLTPAFKDYLWGGERLKTEFGKQTEIAPLAESWELSIHKDGPSVIADGEWQGKTLPEFLAAHPEALGTDCPVGGLPVLIKLIDAKQQLSVQVHPTEEYAQRVEHEHGKTEMWYVLAAEPGAELLYGFKREISKEEFRAHIENGTLLEDINAVKVQPGDVLFIDAGTLHGIGAGIVIAEIQQNSNSTYRIFDYQRRDKNGSLRELHIDKALDVTQRCAPRRDTKPFGRELECDGYTETLLGLCDYFSVTRLRIAKSAPLCAKPNSYQALLCTDGAAVLAFGEQKTMLKKGETMFVPAGCGDYTAEGRCELLVTTL